MDNVWVTILSPSHLVKSLQLSWRSGTPGFYLLVLLIKWVMWLDFKISNPGRSPYNGHPSDTHCFRTPMTGHEFQNILWPSFVSWCQLDWLLHPYDFLAALTCCQWSTNLLQIIYSVTLGDLFSCLQTEASCWQQELANSWWRQYLTHWGQDKMAAIFQTTLSNTFS